MKKLIVAILVLVALSIPVTVFAHVQTISTTVFYACEDSTGVVDAITITQQDTLDCADGTHGTFNKTVQWSVTGPQGLKGDQGIQGTQGPKGDKGDKGDSGTNGTNGVDGKPGIPFSQPACTEKLTGPAQQENLLFCISGIEPDGGFVYKAAISAASVRTIVGTPISATPSVDWSNQPITYVAFTSGFHAEYHADSIVRIYNTLNQRVA